MPLMVRWRKFGPPATRMSTPAMPLARLYLLASGPTSIASISPLASASICASGSITRNTIVSSLAGSPHHFSLRTRVMVLAGRVDALELERPGRREGPILPALVEDLRVAVGRGRIERAEELRQSAELVLERDDHFAVVLARAARSRCPRSRSTTRSGTPCRCRCWPSTASGNPPR